MDPNEILLNIRNMIAETRNTLTDEWLSDNGAELIDAIDALDTWMSNGGFAPDAWIGDDSDDVDDSAHRYIGKIIHTGLAQCHECGSAPDTFHLASCSRNKPRNSWMTKKNRG